jgi:hypothetical protein
MIAPSHSRLAVLGLVTTLAIAAGCGDAGKARQTAQAGAQTAPPPCQATLDEAVGVAVKAYIKDAKPKPERFLISAGTDSALGDGGLTALQDKGPTYLFPGDPALQAQVRSQLHEKGDYTTLLVVRKGAEKKEREASVSLDGHYVGGETDGQHAGPRSFRLACDTSGWHLTS